MSGPVTPGAAAAPEAANGTTLPDAIRAEIDPAALQRIPKLFDASFRTRLAEVLQNARRAGATEVRLTLEAMAETAEHGTAAAEADAEPGAEADAEADAEAWVASAPGGVAYEPVACEPARRAFLVTVEDNGCGIDRPETLLAFGNSAWQERAVADEDPAGMGLASLAGCGACITSRPADGPAWSVTLTTEHFTGSAAAAIEPATRSGPGTTVRFPTGPIDPDSVGSIVYGEIRHYPVAVRYARSDHQGEPPLLMERPQPVPFLADSDYREAYRGLTLGVIRSPDIRFATRGAADNTPAGDLNVFGHRVQIGLPTITSLDGTYWQVFADVDSCPELELVLPDRNAAIQNAFLDELREAAQCVLYRGLRESRIKYPPADGDPFDEARMTLGPVYVSHDDWTAAQQRGIELEVPPARLQGWSCRTAGTDRHRTNRQPTVDVDERTWCIPDDEAEVECIGEIPDLLALKRALGEQRDDVPVLVNPRTACAGYPWHRALPTVTEVRAYAITRAGTFRLAGSAAPDGADPLADEVEQIQVWVTLTQADGSQRTEVLKTSLAFRYRSQRNLYDTRDMGPNGIALVRGHRHDPASILKAATEAFYDSRDYYRTPRPDVIEFTERLERQITTRLVSAERAATEALAKLAGRATALLPPGHEATVTVRAGAEPAVTLRKTTDRTDGPDTPTEPTVTLRKTADRADGADTPPDTGNARARRTGFFARWLRRAAG